MFISSFICAIQRILPFLIFKLSYGAPNIDGKWTLATFDQVTVWHCDAITIAFIVRPVFEDHVFWTAELQASRNTPTQRPVKCLVRRLAMAITLRSK